MSEKYKFNSMSIMELQKQAIEFWIPDYQRGYRWENQQVNELLRDIRDFSILCAGNAERAGYYCLQPIILKQDASTKKYEVIDGQQRLTTIYLILNYLEQNFPDDIPEYAAVKFTITYQTLAKKDVFLKEIDFVNHKIDDSNIDFFHMTTNLGLIDDYIKSLRTKRVSFIDTFYEKTKILWYEILDTSSKNNASEKIFQNINAGKIPLTNAELIKALLLNADNFNEVTEMNRQKEWGDHWDNIEKALHNDDFWFFLTSLEENENIDTRIDLIFDIIAAQKEDKCEELANNSGIIGHQYKTFNILYHLWSSRDKNAKRAFVKEVLDEMKHISQLLTEWYEDEEYYHYIGFLRCFEVPLEKIYSKTKDKKKNEIKSTLKSMITDKPLYIRNIDIPNLTYGESKKVRRILLLFNILSLGKGTRFSFKHYKTDTSNDSVIKKKGWDLEHIHSQCADVNVKERSKWLEIFVESCKDMPDKQIQDLINRAEKILQNKTELENENNPDYENLEKGIINLFGGEGGDGIDNIVLLDAQTNREYKNTIFPYKRKKLIEKEQEGKFIPVCTKNVFLKFYSKECNDYSKMFQWTDKDKSDYLEKIQQKIGNFIEETQNEQ